MSAAHHWSAKREGGVVTLAHANPPRHTLTAQGVRELHAALDGLEREADLRALVLTGVGEGVFIAHYEVGELAEAAEAGGRARAAPAAMRRLHPFHELCLRLEALPAPTIAALNGNAAGGGCELALACDFRLMAEGPFHFGLPETSVGIIPGAGGTQRMARLLGAARALDLILHARLLAPREALELGLLHRVVPAERFRDEVRAFAADLAGRAPIALAASKRAIRRGLELPLAEGLALEQEEFERTMRSEDATGAMRAWLRGERFAWKGK
jgi:enoyl-CoA hydratase